MDLQITKLPYWTLKKSTINLILELDKNNGNAYLTKAIINIYLFDRKEAREAINYAKRLEISKENTEIIKIIDGLNYLLEMKFINAYKTFI